MNFVLVGDDFPAAQTLQLLSEFAEARVGMVFSSPQPERSAKIFRLASSKQIPFYSSDLLRESEGHALLAAQPLDWLININSTVLLPRSILELPLAGALNMHPGLLPEYAGLHTHQWALRNGDKEFGATIHIIEPMVDTGDILLQRRFPIEATDTGLTLFYKCIREGIVGMREVLQKILSNEPLPRTPQDLSRRRLYRHRDALDGRIDWCWLSAEIERFVRAGNYAPLSSPTYTAHLDPVPAGLVEVLKVSAVSYPESAAPGTILGNPSKMPLVACGDGQAIRIEQGRMKGGSQWLDGEELGALFPQGMRLLGRREIDLQS